MDRRLEIEGAVEAAWSELGFAQRAQGITDRNVELLRQLATIAETRYRVGSGLQQDVLRAHVELTVLHEERLSRAAAIEGASARLAALLDLPIGTDFPETDSLLGEAALPSLEPLLASVAESNPHLRAQAARVDEASQRVREARFEGYPDFDLGLGYRLRKSVEGDPVAGDDFVSAGVTVRLPVNRSKWRSRVAEREALLRRAKADHRALAGQVAARIRIAHAELRRADSEATLLGTGLVPQAEQSLLSSRSGYEVGRIDFLSLLDSQVRLLQAELRLVRARADRRQAYAALEAATGETLR